MKQHRSRPKQSRYLAPLLTVATLYGCSLAEHSAPEPALATSNPAHGAAVTTDRSLYRALGGQRGIHALTAEFIRELSADERLRHHFRDTDITRFHRVLQEQICKLSGGGCRYTGDTMKDTHAGLGISRVDFNATVEALTRAMDRTGVAVGAQNRLLALLAPMRKDIVEDYQRPGSMPD